jgi:acetyl-CoA/propionyl-CoA carboxylase biotin carboxyl carrier protein
MAAMDTLLIANRGEIALRVIRACRALGLRSVAIYTDRDRQAPHLRAADDAVRVESYLDIDAVVGAATASGAGAIHPGYGFLSERAEFARAVERAGLVLVGPSAEVMEQMGRKDAARTIAERAGVPVVPHFEGGVPEEMFPVLVKAAAGGGGKGMRIVRTPEEYDAAVAAAKREAMSAFGDDTILVEKYVEHGRHIEVQVLADTHGNVVHLFERDCSTQRRHQKVLEEAPAPTIGDDVRRLVTESAVALAKAVGYVNAGTVEFLLDSQTNQAYFLEMNTRLQVEHPVTELAVTVGGGPLDLVQLQLRVAQGRPLPFGQADVAFDGHAIEARVYAEDPFAGFLPQAGTASYVHWSPAARVDAALESGAEVSTAYDPMLGKVIVHGADREAARRALVASLDDTAILGLTTNIGFLRILAASDAFRDCEIDTAWLDRTELHLPDDDAPRILAAWTEAMAPPDERAGPFASDGWRIGGTPAPIRVDLESEPQVFRTGHGTGRTDGYDVRELARQQVGGATRLTVELGGHDLAYVGGPRQTGFVLSGRHAVEVAHRGQRWVFARPDVFADHGPVAGEGTVAAPMPGTVLAVNVEPGQQVAAGAVLGLMEAMKMELALKAPFDGLVSAVHAGVGDQVDLGATLFVVEGADDA